MNGAEFIVEYLICEKVPYVFGLCGHGNVGLLEALRQRRDEIKYISVHHEQAAGHMADAYYRVAHRPVVTLTSCGPGSCNLPVALGSAMMDSAAFLAITGNVPTQQFNRGPFQETYRHYQADFPSVLRPYVKRSFQPTRVEMLPITFRQAFRIMTTGRVGPVHVDIPLNLFAEEGDFELYEPESWRNGTGRRSAGDQTAIERAADLLLGAERPVVLAGHGLVVSEGCELLQELVSLLGLPAINSPNAKGALDMRDPLALGDVGRNGTYPANRASTSCDVLLALGCRFDDRVSSSWIPGYSFTIPPTKLIQVDIDPEEIERNYPVEIGLLGDARSVLEQLLNCIKERLPHQTPHWTPWRERVAAWQQEWDHHIASYAEMDSNPIHPGYLVSTLRQVLPEDGILVTDVGIHHNWLVQLWPSYQPQTLLQSWGFASMGFGVCGVLGAKLAAPERLCVAVVGDGGFLMTSHAVATAVEYGIDVTWVVWNNQGYVSIRDLQLGIWNEQYGTSFLYEPTGRPYSADYVGLAHSLGAKGIRVTNPRDLQSALCQAITDPSPYVVEVVVDDSHKPASVGTWSLPPFPHPEPDFPSNLAKREE